MRSRSLVAGVGVAVGSEEGGSVEYCSGRAGACEVICVAPDMLIWGGGEHCDVNMVTKYINLLALITNCTHLLLFFITIKLISFNFHKHILYTKLYKQVKLEK